jgi:NADH-quinone oxidoreductase subunit G
VKNLGESRPGWKVLRMLGAILGLPGFQAETLQDIRNAIAPDLGAWAAAGLDNGAADIDWEAKAAPATLERIAEFPLYATDPIVRRSLPLQRTAHARAARAATFHPATAAALGLAAGDRVRIVQGGGEARLPVAVDAALAEGCVRIARGIPETALLGEGDIAVEKVPEAAAA